MTNTPFGELWEHPVTQALISRDVARELATRAEVVTECVCGQLPALEPARREVDALTLAACSDPFCAACLAQIAANEETSAAPQ